MRRKFKYFILNKSGDFEAGSGATVSAGGISCGGKPAVYFSKVFDCGTKAMQWYKAQIDFDLPPNTVCKITFYSSERSELSVDKESTTIEQLLKSELSDEEKSDAIAPYEKFSSALYPDILLTKVKGRYLWFKIEFSPSSDASPTVKSIRLCFDCCKWINYLPEIYRGDDGGFTERYLNIFQTLYEDMERRIEENPINYTAENADTDFLNWLADQYCIKEKNLWSEVKLRYILANASRIYSLMGTKDIILELSELYLGEKPIIYEYYQSNEEMSPLPAGITREQVFINPYVFTVVIRGENLDVDGYRAYLKILESCKPAHMEANVIVLSAGKQSGIQLGHTYISDITSYERGEYH